MLAIAGSGFGLYGYLPALLLGGRYSVVLPEKYRAVINRRPELRQFETRAHWAADLDDAVARASGVVVALRPADQFALVTSYIGLPHLSTFVLEKPFAPSPAAARQLHSGLLAAGKRFRIGYLFRHTAWAHLLRQSIEAGSASSAQVDWEFHAHHFRTGQPSWKQDHQAGGGALRFYGIHIVALLAERGYRRVVESTLVGSAPDQPEEWHAVFANPDLPPVTVHVRTRAERPAFRVLIARASRVETIVDQDDPFFGCVAPSPELDQRVGLIAAALEQVGNEAPVSLPWYSDVLDLWEETEARSVFVLGPGPSPAGRDRT